MRTYENKEQCVADIKTWGRTWGDSNHYPKPAPFPEDLIERVPLDVERIIIGMSGHRIEHERQWTMWFNEKLNNVCQSLSVIGQMFNQSWDWHGKSGVIQYGRKELKAKLQADIDRLQALVNEL